MIKLSCLDYIICPKGKVKLIFFLLQTRACSHWLDPKHKVVIRDFTIHSLFKIEVEFTAVLEYSAHLQQTKTVHLVYCILRLHKWPLCYVRLGSEDVYGREGTSLSYGGMQHWICVHEMDDLESSSNYFCIHARKPYLSQVCSSVPCLWVLLVPWLFLTSLQE